MMSLSKIFRHTTPILPTRVFAPAVLAQTTTGDGERTGADVSLEKAQDELGAIRRLIEQEEVRLAEVSATVDAMLADAQALAQQLVADAKGQIAADRQAQMRVGYKEGLQDGRCRAIEEQQSFVEQAQRVVQDAQRERRARILGAEGFVVDLALVVAQRVLERELVVDDRFLLDLTRNLLAEVDKAHRVELRVAPGDYASMLTHRSVLEKMLYQRAECVIVPDHMLRAGDLLVVTEMGTVDGRLDVRLEGVRKILQSVAKEWERLELVDGEIAQI